MEQFKRAKWIWVDKQSTPDTYGEFYDEFVWEGDAIIQFFRSVIHILRRLITLFM